MIRDVVPLEEYVHVVGELVAALEIELAALVEIQVLRYIVAKLVEIRFDEIQAILMNRFGAAEPVHFLHFLAFVFVLTVLLMIVISAIRPAARLQSNAPDGRASLEPWRYAKVASAVVVVCTLAFYIALAQ